MCSKKKCAPRIVGEIFDKICNYWTEMYVKTFFES